MADAQAQTIPHGHRPVLADAVLDTLAPQPGQTLVDCTLGRGGHASLLLPLIPGGRYLAFDLDASNADYAQARLAPLAQQHGVTLDIVHASFTAMPAELDRRGITELHAILADLGFASNQVDDPQRGLSFLRDGPLDMRLDPTDPVTAQQLVNQLPEKELADLIYRFGEERKSRRIARKIVEVRRTSPISSTVQLADLVRRALGPGGNRPGFHPATRTFQALRIAVNGELDALDALLAIAPSRLRPASGRLAVISFHSLEDRPVKQAMQNWDAQGLGTRLTRKPVVATPEEAHDNPRARSAKLRGFQFSTLNPH
ncbi:MAG: 16S rRNA (cytosine(1402)-N(4))-methyltransferase RsmH [Planctomycetota bacterium]